MNTILVISILSIILCITSFVVGFNRGEEITHRTVFKNCLAANIRPEVCLQYMKILKNGK